MSKLLSTDRRLPAWACFALLVLINACTINLAPNATLDTDNSPTNMDANTAFAAPAATTVTSSAATTSVITANGNTTIPNAAASATTKPNLRLSAEEIYRLVSPSTPFVNTAEGSGSGILIEGGYILTNYHVVEPYRTVRVVFPNGAEFRNTPVVGWDSRADLAVLGPVDVLEHPLELTNGEDMDLGSELFLVGYPAEYELYPDATITRGILSRIREWENNITILQTDASIAGGQSGGALVDSRGKVIGISTYSYSEALFGWAISSNDILPIVEDLIRSGYFDRQTENTPEGLFISVLSSENSEASAEQELNRLERQYSRRFDILYSSYYASLNPGYWVVYAGPFYTPEEAQNTCWELDRRTGALCYGRRLSQDPRDVEIVYPPKQGRGSSGADERIEPIGTYVSVLVSETTQASAIQKRNELEQQHDRRFGILYSSDFESLRPGYWVVYAGPFYTPEEAQHTCWELDRRTGALCYGRRLSQDPGDVEIVYPPKPG